jgi:hypothetical protein
VRRAGCGDDLLSGLKWYLAGFGKTARALRGRLSRSLSEQPVTEATSVYLGLVDLKHASVPLAEAVGDASIHEQAGCRTADAATAQVVP